MLLKFVDRYGGIAQHVMLFTVVARPEVPYCRERRFETTDLGGGFVSVRMHVGFMERADVRAPLSWLEHHGLVRVPERRWTIVVGREEILAEGGGPLWRSRLTVVAWMSLLTVPVWEWFGLGQDDAVSTELVPVRARRGALEVVVVDRPRSRVAATVV